MAKKRVIHCGKCESPVQVYKKGKKHRVFVCPSCGIIATNPGPMAFGLALKAGRAIPGPTQRGLIAAENLGLIPSEGEAATETTCSTAKGAPRRNLAPFYINKALAGGTYG